MTFVVYVFVGRALHTRNPAQWRWAVIYRLSDIRRFKSAGSNLPHDSFYNLFDILIIIIALIIIIFALWSPTISIWIIFYTAPCKKCFYELIFTKNKKDAIKSSKIFVLQVSVYHYDLMISAGGSGIGVGVPRKIMTNKSQEVIWRDFSNTEIKNGQN